VPEQAKSALKAKLGVQSAAGCGLLVKADSYNPANSPVLSASRSVPIPIHRNSATWRLAMGFSLS
jgi:hypothetical protein